MSHRICRGLRASGDSAELTRMAFDINDLDPDLFPDDEPLELRPEGGNPQGMSAPTPEAESQPSIPLEPNLLDGGFLDEDVSVEPQVQLPEEPVQPPDEISIPSNRPAEGALRATAETELSKSWEGGEGASDFLGLDEEMRAPAPQAPQAALDLGGSIPLEGAAPSPAPAADDGLFGGDGEQSWLLENNEKPLHVAGTPSAQEDVAEENGEPVLAGAAAGATFVEHSPSAGKGKLVLMVCGLMLLAASATFVFSPKPTETNEEAATGLERGRAPLEAPRIRRNGNIELTDPDGPPPTIERTPLSEVALPSDEELLAELRELAGVVLDGPIRLAQEQEEGGSKSIDSEASVSAESSLIGPLSVINADGTLADGSRLAGADTPFGLPVGGTGSSPWETAMRAAEAKGAGQSGESFAAGELDTSEAARASRTTQILPESSSLLPSVEAHLHRANEEDLANLWPGTEAPLDQMKRDGQLLTPRVGRVRVLIEDDEIFEGKLYAVGSGGLWLDTRLGRLALEAQQIQEVVRIDGNSHTPTPGDKGSQNLTGLARVGVKAPGGTIYGKVVKQEGDHVTLIPDIGGRITLDGVAVEGLSGEVRTTIVRLADASEMTR